MRTSRSLTLQLTLLLAGAVSSRTTTPKLSPSTAEAGFQLETATVSTLKVRPASVDTSFHRTSSFALIPRLRSSPSTTDFQTASLVAFTLKSSPSTGATDWQLANFSASVLRFSPSPHTTGIQISRCSAPEIPRGVTSGYTPGNSSTAGNPLPLLAKILIPVAGVLLILLVVFTWYCCVRKKENGDINDFVIESTVMVRFGPEDSHSSA